jgi:hypothetical protein
MHVLGKENLCYLWMAPTISNPVIQAVITLEQSRERDEFTPLKRLIHFLKYLPTFMFA